MSAPSNNGTLNPQTVTGGDAGSVIIGPTTIKNDTLFEQNVNIYGTLTVSGFQTDYDSLHVTNDLTVGDLLEVTGDSTFIGNIRTNESATVDLDLLVSGASHLVGAVTTDSGITETLSNITATLGNIAATAGSVSAGTTVTAGTGITATTGDVNVLVGGVVAEDSLTTNSGDVNVTLGGVFAGGAIDAGTTVHAGTNITAAGTIVATGTMGASNLSGTNTGDQTITLTGDVTGSGMGSFAATLANTAVTPAAYTNANITVDSKGRITAAASGTSNAITPTSISTAGNLTFSGTATSQRILGDFSSATASQRTMIQSITANGVTRVSAIPNGTATTTSWATYNAADADNAAYLTTYITNSLAAIQSAKNGTGTLLPFQLQMNAVVALAVDVNGYVTVAPSGGRVGFYGVTPVVKAAAIAAPTDLATCITAINAIRTALTNMGITA